MDIYWCFSFPNHPRMVPQVGSHIFWAGTQMSRVGAAGPRADLVLSVSVSQGLRTGAVGGSYQNACSDSAGLGWTLGSAFPLLMPAVPGYT